LPPPTCSRGGIEDKPEASLDRLCQLALEAQIYRECLHYYPFVLGAEPVRPVDLAAFFATIANEGLRPAPHVIDSLERDGTVIYRHNSASPARISSVDRAAFYQLKTMMQGVLARGTAQSIADLAPYVAGKTGTSDDENDAWFVGFTNEVTVAVWIGYDNANGKRRTLGGGATGAVSQCRSSSLSFARCGMTSRRGLHLRRLRLRPSATSRARRSMQIRVRSDDEARQRFPSACASTPKAGSSIRRCLGTRWEPACEEEAKRRRSAFEKMASRERHRRYASERIPTQVRQVAPQWGFFGGGGFGGGGWFGSATQYGGGFWGR
jgi:membrane peptidoglycan carboxypeptidase